MHRWCLVALYGLHIFLCSLHSLHRTAGSSSCAVWWAVVLQPHLKGEVMQNILYAQTFNTYKPGNVKEFCLNSIFQVWKVYIYTRIYIFLDMLCWKIFQKYGSLLDNDFLPNCSSESFLFSWSNWFTNMFEWFIMKSVWIKTYF